MSAPCCALRSKNALIVVLLIALAVTTTGWILEARKQPASQPPVPVETVEILVAAKDLNTGNVFTAENNDRLTKFAVILKSELPRESVTDKQFFVGKRIGRPLLKGEPFKTSDVGKPAPDIFGDERDIMSILMPTTTPIRANGEAVRSGVRVDILATHPNDESGEVFTLLPDMLVLAVNGISEIRLEGDPRPFSNDVYVSFAVNPQQATILTLAKQQNCKLELLLRHPDAPPRKDWSYEQTLKRLQPRIAVAPAPRVKE